MRETTKPFDGRLLIVHPDLAEATGRASDLARAGLRCWATASPDEALQLARSNQEIRVLLVDCPLEGRAASFVWRFRQLRPDVTTVGMCMEERCDLCWLGVDHSLSGQWRATDLTDILVDRGTGH